MNIKKETVFYLEEDQEKTARVVILEDGKTYNIVHTYVDDRYRGQGVGWKLIEQAVQYVKQQNGVLKADCSYAAHMLRKFEIPFEDTGLDACSIKHAKED